MPVRRNHQERSEASRRALVGQPLQTLVDKGVAGTSATVVSKQAGALVGCALRHYASKNDLLVETAVQVQRSQLERLPFYELRLGARFDPTLRKGLSQSEWLQELAISDVCGELFPDLGAQPRWSAASSQKLELLRLSQGQVCSSTLSSRIACSRWLPTSPSRRLETASAATSPDGGEGSCRARAPQGEGVGPIADLEVAADWAASSRSMTEVGMVSEASTSFNQAEACAFAHGREMRPLNMEMS